jgi:hypothetical protein
MMRSIVVIGLVAEVVVAVDVDQLFVSGGEVIVDGLGVAVVRAGVSGGVDHEGWFVDVGEVWCCEALAVLQAPHGQPCAERGNGSDAVDATVRGAGIPGVTCGSWSG